MLKDDVLIRLSASAVVQRLADGRFLIVEEVINGRVVLDIPGGTWEDGETLLQTVVREAAEEAGITFQSINYLGCFITHYTSNSGRSVCNVRAAFCGAMGEAVATVSRDPSTQAVHWMSLEELEANLAQLRSSATLRCIRAYLSGRRFPLDYCNEEIDL